MPYTLNFSDPSNPNKITVPDMPPGINTVDTSLNLVGKGYPNYGEKTAENFLHLLENFASPYPGPNNPIEGQLWYDTTDPDHKVLRIRDGINWSNANGIYQQGDDPRTSPEAPASLRAGDIWVDTSNYQLKIFNKNNWTLVGPMITEENTAGLTVETLYGINDIPEVTPGKSVVKLWSNGDIVAIISNKKFTPRTIISGFNELVPGINLRSTSASENDPTPILNGTAKNARNLEINGVIVNANDVLRKDDTTSRSQVITGKVFFKTSVESINDAGYGQGNDGIVMNNQSSTDDSRYIQFYKGASDAIVLNNHSSGKIVFKVNDGTASLLTVLEAGSTNITFNSPAVLNKPLTVQSGTTINGNLTVNSTASISGGLTVEGVSVINDNLTVTGQLIIKRQTDLGSPIPGPAILPYTTGIYNIGSQTNYFNQLFVNSIGTSSTSTILYGKVIGSATSLEYGTEFKMSGQVSSNNLVFSGNDGTSTFVTTLTTKAISDQPLFTSAGNLTFLALNTASNQLGKIELPTVVNQIYLPGIISAYGSATPPSGWLLCDGGTYSTTLYPALYAVIGSSYGSAPSGNFKVPNYTSSATGGYTIYYIIKT